MNRGDRPAPCPSLLGGVAALTKALLLVAGVPLAALRLDLLAGSEPLDSGLSLTLHLVLGGVAALWLLAVIELGGEIRRALRAPGGPGRASWSSSWAAGIVGLLLVAGALGSHGGRVRAPTPVTRAIASGAPGRLVAPPSRRSAPEELVGALGTLLAAGIWRRTRLLVRLRLSLRATGGRAKEMSGDLAGLSLALACSESGRAIDWIEAANRLLGSRFVGGSEHLPDIRLVRIGDEGLELLLGTPAPAAPAPFVAAHGGRWWLLDRSVELEALEALGAGAPRLFPALLPVGSDGTGEVLVALGPGRSLGIVGAQAQVDGALGALVTALRVLPWCDELAVELLGIEPPPLAERTVHLQQSSPETLEALRTQPAVARGAMTDQWRREPFVVVDRRALVGLSGDRIAQVAHEIGGIVSGRAADLTLRLDAGTATLEPLGLALCAPELSRPGQALVDGLLLAYAQPQRVVPLGDAPGRDRTPRPKPACVVRLLGPAIELNGAGGAPHPDDCERVGELLAYLALHGRRVERVRLLAELFAHGADQAAGTRLENLCAIARATCGPPAPGGERIVAADDREVVLDGAVVLDWELLAARFSAARRLDGARAARELHEALGGLDGAHLLDGVAAFPWFVAQHFDEEIRAGVIDACHHLATLCLASGEHERVRFAVGLGATVEPGSEIIARDAMVLADATGRPDEVDGVYRTLLMALAELGGSEPSALTHRLYLALRPPASDPVV